MNVNTEHCCSSALSACHAAARRCRFVPEHAVPLITKSHFSFGEFTGWGSSPLCLLSLESGTSADGRGSPCCCLKDERVMVRVLPLQFHQYFYFITETIIAWSCLGWQARWRAWGQPNRPEPSQPGPEGTVKADAWGKYEVQSKCVHLSLGRPSQWLLETLVAMVVSVVPHLAATDGSAPHESFSAFLNSLSFLPS